MALRDQSSRVTWRAVAQSLALAASEADKKHLERALADITPREIYEAEGMLSALPTTIISGHVRFALQHFDCLPLRDLRKEMTDCLVDGFVLYRLRAADDSEPLQEDPQIISHCDWEGRDLRGVWIKYEYWVDQDGAMLSSPGEAEGRKIHAWCYEEHVYRLRELAPIDPDNPDSVSTEVGEAAYRRTRRYPAGREKDYREYPWSAPELLDFFPYRGVRWIEHRSLLAPVKSTILRYETALMNIATENNRHARRKMVGRGTGEFQKTVEEYAEEGLMVIPPNSDVFYPDTHADGVRVMYEELDRLEALLRDNVGLVKVADLHNASGTSRQFEVAPNIAQAESIRDSCREIMRITTGGDAFSLSFRPLVQHDPDQLVVLKRIYDESLAQGVISPQEHAERMRFLLSFPKQPGLETQMVALQAAAAFPQPGLAARA